MSASRFRFASCTFGIALILGSVGIRPSYAATGSPAVAYQSSISHDGSQASNLSAPLTRKWAVDLGGRVSYPLIVGGKTFVTVANVGAYGTKLYALNSSTGSTAWGPVDLGGTYNWSGIAYDGGRIFAVNGAGLLRSFDAASGAPSWTVQLPGQYSFDSAPTADGGVVYVGGSGSGGTLYAVNESSGAVLWTRSVQNGDTSSPALSSTAVFVSYACQQAYAFDRTNGSLLWHHTSSCAGGGGKTPVLYDGRLYVRDAPLGNVILDATSGAPMGSFSAGPAPAFAGANGFFLSGSTLNATNVQSSSIVWSFSGDGGLSTAPTTSNGLVLVGSTSGELFALNQNTGSTVWHGNVGSPILGPDEQNVSQPLTGMAVGEDLLVVPATNRLVAYANADAPPPPPPPPPPPITTAMSASPAIAELGPPPTVYFPNLTATLKANGRPLSGKLVRFTAGGAFVCSATTDSAGKASCGGVTQEVKVLRAKSYIATFAGDTNYVGSSASAKLIRVQ